MTISVNPARLRAERRRRGWSQDHLAGASGVSVRTIQRLEQGRAATPSSIMALSAAMDLSMADLTTRTSPVRRVTPLTILDEIGPGIARYCTLGFTMVETGHPGCIGLRAGNTALILCSTDFMTSHFHIETIKPLVGLTIPYIWVDSLAQAIAAWDRVIETVSTDAGTRESLVEATGQHAILAETVP